MRAPSALRRAQNNVVFGDEPTGGEAGAQAGELFRALCRA